MDSRVGLIDRETETRRLILIVRIETELSRAIGAIQIKSAIATIITVPLGAIIDVKVVRTGNIVRARNAKSFAVGRKNCQLGMVVTKIVIRRTWVKDCVTGCGVDKKGVIRTIAHDESIRRMSGGESMTRRNDAAVGFDITLDGEKILAGGEQTRKSDGWG